MDERKTFMDRYRDGECGAGDIHDHIEQWHQGDSELPLHEYLGMSRASYCAWVERSRSLEQILATASPAPPRPPR